MSLDPPAVPGWIEKGSKVRIGLRRVPGNMVVTDHMEFRSDDVRAQGGPEVVMAAVRNALERHFNLTPKEVGLITHRGGRSGYTAFSCVAHLSGLQPRDTDMGSAISAFRSGGQAIPEPEVPDFIDI